MIRIFNRINFWPDTHLLLLWLLTLPAVMPLVQPTITRSADGLLHLYRVVALGHALQQSQTLFPRWLPDLAYGYGFPLFIFYAPLSYYITLALSLVGQLMIAFNLSFALALFLAGSGVYLFVKEIFGPKAGLLAGVTYAYAPFQLLNTFSRGGLPAAWAMALFPFVFWLFGRLIRQSPIKVRKMSSLLPLSAFVLGAALLTHNTLSLLFMPLLGLYLGLELLVRYLCSIAGRTGCNLPYVQPHSQGRIILQIGLAVTLGVSLATFFLMPAIVEKEFAQVERVITPPDFDFHFNFVTFTDLLRLPAPANTGLLNPDVPLTLGAAQVGLALLGLASLLSCLFNKRRDARAATTNTMHVDSGLLHASSLHVTSKNRCGKPQPGIPDLNNTSISAVTITIFAIIALSGIIFMMLPLSVKIWERIPLLAFIQFPHRLLGPAAFVLATLAGAAIATLPQRWAFRLTTSGSLLVFVTTVPLLYPQYHDQLPAKPSLVDMMAYEHASGAIGTTSFGEYLPRWVKQVPDESPLEPMYQSNAIIERLDQAYLPPNARIEAAGYRFNEVELVINSPEPFQAIFHTFYFPGWKLLVNGQPGSVAPVTERGLIGISLPAGRSQLHLYFQETPLRRMANAISGVALVVIIAGLVRHRLPSKSNPDVVNSPSPMTGFGFERSQKLALTGLAITLVAIKAFYLDQFENPFKYTFDGTTIAQAEVPRQVDFGGEVNLLGYTLDRSTVLPGQEFILTSYWQARRPLITNYSALAQLVDLDHHLYAGQDNLHPGTLRTTLWQPWGFVKDPHTIPIPPGTPPGDYLLVTGLYDPITGIRLPVVSGGDSGWGDVIAIPVTVSQPDSPPTIEQLGIRWPATAKSAALFESSALSSGVIPIRLLGATPERESFPRNDFLRIALFWEAKTAPNTDYQVSLRLVAGDGSTVLQETTHPSHNRYPTTFWTIGERVRDNHALWIPPDFPAGQYRIQTQVVDGVGQAAGAWVELGVIKVGE